MSVLDDIKKYRFPDRQDGGYTVQWDRIEIPINALVEKWIALIQFSKMKRISAELESDVKTHVYHRARIDLAKIVIGDLIGERKAMELIKKQVKVCDGYNCYEPVDVAGWCTKCKRCPICCDCYCDEVRNDR